MFLSTPITPKDGRCVQVLLICRVSSPGEGKQDIRSLDDQEQMLRRWVADNMGANVEITVIAGSGSGERLDRREVFQAEEAVESGRLDLVLAEDLGRILRRNRALDFCELAEDHKTRVIALNDNVDTAQHRWRTLAAFAAMRHEMSNEDTSDRIKRTQDNRFGNGGLLRPPLFGYIKPPGAKHENDLQRDPQAEPILDHWFRMLEEGASFAEVADYLNDNQVPVGPSARSNRWSCKMVGRITRHPLLKGIRRRHERISRRQNSTGKHVTEKARVEDRVERFVPHLVFIDPARWERVNRLLCERNANRRRGRKSGVDVRAGVPKKRTRWPGQHLRCGVCGRIFVYQGWKDTAHLMCSGATQYQCWNSCAVDGPLAAKAMSGALLAQIEQLPGFNEALLESLQRRIDDYDGDREKKREQLIRDLSKNERELSNLIDAIKQFGMSTTVQSSIRAAETQKQQLVYDLAALDNTRCKPPELPCMDDIRSMARREIQNLSHNSQEFYRLMRHLMPEIFVFPYQLIDGGQTRLRAQAKLDLSRFATDWADEEAVQAHLSGELIVDLFEPPQREQFREEVWRLTNSTSERLTERQLAARIGITQPAVQYAKALQRQMDAAGRTDAYVPITAPIEGNAKLRRHKHPRFKFEPLSGFPRPWPTA